MNLKNIFPALLAGALSLVALDAGAHTFSVYADQHETYRGTMAVTHIGWGHAIPFDDFVEGDSLAAYALYDPSGAKSELPHAKDANMGGEGTSDIASGKVHSGDPFLLRIDFDKNAAKGTHTVAAEMKQSVISMYMDKNGKRKFAAKNMDEIKDADKFIVSANYQNFAKSYVAVGEWTEPKPIGQALEIIPLTDLSKVKPGDDAKFKVLLNGKPLVPEKGEPKLMASGEFFGQGKGYEIAGGLDGEGVATIKVIEPGRWLVQVDTMKPVGPDNRPDLVGKTLTAGYNASVTFMVAPR